MDWGEVWRGEGGKEVRVDSGGKEEEGEGIRRRG